MGYLFQIGMRAVSSLWKDEDGIGTLELVLIVAVLIVVALFFKDQILEFMGNLMDKVEGKADEVFE